MRVQTCIKHESCLVVYEEKDEDGLRLDCPVCTEIKDFRQEIKYLEDYYWRGLTNEGT